MTSVTEKILLTTLDPTVNLNGRPVPAITTLLHRVCDNNEDMFQEATRIVELFINKALEYHDD